MPEDKAGSAVEHGRSASNAGPENKLLKDLNPDGYLPPATDHGEVQTFWSSFSSAHRCIQEGGWSRQVTVADFPHLHNYCGSEHAAGRGRRARTALARCGRVGSYAQRQRTHYRD